MLSNDKILAHKRNGNSAVFLTQADSSFFLIFARLVGGKKGMTIKVLAKKELSPEEAEIALKKLTEGAPVAYLAPASLSPAPFSTSTSTVAQPCEALLLENPKSDDILYTKEIKALKPTLSPYFPTKEIFLTHQMTCAPNTLNFAY